MGRSTSCRLPRMEGGRLQPADAYSEKKRISRSAWKQLVEPDAEDVKGFDEFMVRYHAGLPIERSAVTSISEK